MMKQAEIFLSSNDVKYIRKWGFYIHFLLVHPDFAVRSLNSIHHPRSAFAFIPPALVDLKGEEFTWKDYSYNVVTCRHFIETLMPMGAIFVDSRDIWTMNTLSTIKSLGSPLLYPDSPVAIFIDSHDL